MHRLTLVSLLLAAVAACESAAAGNAPATAVRSTAEARVEISVEPFGHDKRRRIDRAHLFSGHDSPVFAPATVVNSVQINWRGQSFFIPKSLVTGLGEPSITYGFKVKQIKRSLVIALHGGDGAGSYQCDWHVDLDRLVVSRSAVGLMGTPRLEDHERPLVPKRV